MKRGLLLLLAVTLLATPQVANAALTLTLAPVAQNAARGSELVFSGTLTNTSGTDRVFLNDLQATFAGGAGAMLTLGANSFFAHVPGILFPGEIYAGVLFRVSLNGRAPAGDYGGTIVVKGGVDIAASVDLAVAQFSVFSPEVSIVASDASASEFGPDPGTVTVSRTGGTDLPLSVAYSISGSANNGVTFAALPTSTIIPAGAASVPLAVTPLPDNLAQGDRAAIFTLAPSGTFNLSAMVSASVTIHDKPADQWRFEKFGAEANSPDAQDLADWEKDGIPNLLEYGLDLDPKAAAANAYPQPDASAGYLIFSYVPNLAATDLTYAVRACADLVSWSTAHLESVNVANPIPPHRVTVRYNLPIDSLDRIFFKLDVTRSEGPP